MSVPYLQQQSCSFGEATACFCAKTLQIIYFLFPFPFLIPCLCFPLTHSQLLPHAGLQQCLRCPGVSASGSVLLPLSESTKCIWGFGLKMRNQASLFLDLWLLECLTDTLGLMRVTCRQTALTNLQQMPRAEGQLDIASAWGNAECHSTGTYVPVVCHWKSPTSLDDSSAWWLQYWWVLKQCVSSSFHDYNALDWTALRPNSKM